jgi:hypothetical protein
MLCGAFSGTAFSQTEPNRYLTPDIMESWIANENALSDGLSELEYNADAIILARFTEYWRQVSDFAYQFQTLIDWADYGRDLGLYFDPAKAYRKILRVRVPQEVNAVYAENGLGEHGHQVFMCLTLGWILLTLKQYADGNDPSLNKIQKIAALLESLIHPQDLTLIEEHAEVIY